MHKEIFMRAGFEQIYHHEKLMYIEASVMMKPNEQIFTAKWYKFTFAEKKQIDFKKFV